MTAGAVRGLGVQLVCEDLISRRVGASYVAFARTTLFDFYQWTEGQGLGDIRKARPADLLRYRDSLAAKMSKTTGEHLKGSTINGRIAVLRLLYACLYRSGVSDKDPAAQITDKLPTLERLRPPMSEEEIQNFLEAIDTTTSQGLRDRALFELIYAAGLRVSEAAQVKVSDVDWKTRLMRVRGKGDKDRLVPISQVAKDVLLLYLGDRATDPEAWIFPGNRGHGPAEPLRSTSVSERFRVLLRRFGMERKDLCAHSVRHSTATHLLDHGVGIRQVQELLGHAHIETTARYTHVVSDNLKRVFRLYHPREQSLYEETDKSYLERVKRLDLTSNPS